MSEMDQEKKFLAGLQKLVAKARKNHNVIAEEELESTFGDMTLNDQQKQQVRDYLKASNIGIDEQLPLEEVISEEEHDFLVDYEEMINSLPRPDENVMTAVKISAMAGEKSAQSQLIEYMLPKVVDIARLYAGQDVLLDDLIGAGNEALTIGVTLLAPLEGPEEVEGAIGKRIMDAMEDLIAANLDERASDQNVVEKVNLVADKARDLAKELGRKVTAEELAHEGELSLSDIEDALRFSGYRIEDIDTVKNAQE